MADDPTISDETDLEEVLDVELEDDLAPRWDSPAPGQRLDGAPGRSELQFTTPRA